MQYNPNTDVTEQQIFNAIQSRAQQMANTDRIGDNLCRELSQYHWRNHVIDGVVATVEETIDFLSDTRRRSKPEVLNDAVALVLDIQSAVSAQRNTSIWNTLSYQEQDFVQAIRQTALEFDRDIGEWNRMRGSVSPEFQYKGRASQGSNPRYSAARNASKAVSVDVGDNPRYRSAASRDAAPQTPEKSTFYVLKNKDNNGMSESGILNYNNHRRASFSQTPASRPHKPDFMGVLSKVDYKQFEEGENVSGTEVTVIDLPIMATCREHADAICAAYAVDLGNVVSADAVLEYTYDEYRALRTFPDNETLRITLIEDMRLVDIVKEGITLTDLATTLGSMLKEHTTSLASVARAINTAATEQVNRFLRYDLNMKSYIQDFHSDWESVMKKLTGDYGVEKVEKVLSAVTADMIERIGSLCSPSKDTDAAVVDALNGIFQKDLAERTIFISKRISVTRVPATLAAFGLTFESLTAMLDPDTAPEMYAAVVALEERLAKGNAGGMRRISRVMLVTEDDVEIEVIPTHIDVKSRDGRKQYVLKILKA